MQDENTYNQNEYEQFIIITYDSKIQVNDDDRYYK